MKILRASEIGSYIYCARAWWYQNQASLALGSQYHQSHGMRVTLARIFGNFSVILLILGTLLVLLYIMQLFT